MNKCDPTYLIYTTNLEGKHIEEGITENISNN